VNPDPEQRIKRIMSGEACGVGPALVRSVLAIAEPFYSAAARLRNHSFDSGRKTVKSLPRPVISIGNVTTGGTGKTPAVRWLAERLRDEGRHVAILSRGYKSVDAGLGDELTMLDRALNAPGKPAVLVRANPDRFIAGTRLLEQAPETNVFILDDGFQHRRLARNLDIVLINALEPFGFDHVLPRGMLREPLTSLRRADAIVVTHCDRVSAEAIGSVESTIRRYHPGVPLYRTHHATSAILEGAERFPIAELDAKPFFAFCGIGSPSTFDAQLAGFAQIYRGHHWFADHHHYTPADLKFLRRAAAEAGAERLVTTEKDWVKIEPLQSELSLPVCRVEIRLQFEDAGEQKLMDQVRAAMAS